MRGEESGGKGGEVTESEVRLHAVEESVGCGVRGKLGGCGVIINANSALGYITILELNGISIFPFQCRFRKLCLA